MNIRLLSTDLPTVDSNGIINGQILTSGSITTEVWTHKYSPEASITKSGVYFIKGTFIGNGGTLITGSGGAQYHVSRKVSNSAYSPVAYAYGSTYGGTMDIREASTILYLAAGDKVAMNVWTGIAGAKFNTQLYIMPIRYL